MKYFTPDGTIVTSAEHSIGTDLDNDSDPDRVDIELRRLHGIWTDQGFSTSSGNSTITTSHRSARCRSQQLISSQMLREQQLPT